MKRSLVLASLVLICVGSSLRGSPPPLSVPAKITGFVGDFLEIPATTSGKNVSWLALDSGLSLFPVGRLKDSLTAVVMGKNPGTYRLLAVTAAGDEISAPAICTIEITATISTPPSPPPPPSPPQPPPSQPAAPPAAPLPNLPTFFCPTCGPNGCPSGPLPAGFWLQRR